MPSTFNAKLALPIKLIEHAACGTKKTRTECLQWHNAVTVAAAQYASCGSGPEWWNTTSTGTRAAQPSSLSRHGPLSS